MIRGELTNLRAMERPDSAALFRWLNDLAVMQCWGFGEAVVSRTRIEQEIEGWLEDERVSGRPSAFVIEDLEGEPIGFALLPEGRHPDLTSELSLMIGERDRWGQGLGSDALDALIEACFGAWGLHRLSAKSEAGNERAHRWLRRAGFRQEGVLRDASYYDGAFHDQLVFGLLATDERRDE